MSDALRLNRSHQAGSAWLSHAGEVAHWTAQLLAWLWIGQQGLRLGWPLAGGVLAIAVWWAMRVLFRGASWAFRCPSWMVGLLGGCTAMGVLAHGLYGDTAWASFGSHGSLVVLASVWGLWSALIETRSLVSTFQTGRLPWQPVLAAALLGLAALGLRVFDAGAGGSALATTGVGLLLVPCTAVLYARDRSPARRARACAGTGTQAHHLLAPSVMGLMMGSLWLGHDWCMGAGWSTTEAVVTHVVLMAGLPVLVAIVLNLAQRVRPGLVFSSAAQELSGLALIALGALMWQGNGTAFSVMAMFLPSVAWALHCNRTRVVRGVKAKVEHSVPRLLALALGPLLLIWVGATSMAQGPGAMRLALTGLGVLAAICCVKKLCDSSTVKAKFEALGLRLSKLFTLGQSIAATLVRN
jgi:hypothetical protein